MDKENNLKKQDGSIAEGPISRLAASVITSSVKNADRLNGELEDKFRRDTDEYKIYSFRVLMEFIFFFLHYINRTIYNEIGTTKPVVMDEIGTMICDAVVEVFFGHWPEGLRNKMKSDFFKNLDMSEIEYAGCKELFKKPWEDRKLIEKITDNKTSEATINLLTDRLAKIITGHVNQDPIFLLGIVQSMTDALFGEEKITGLIHEVVDSQKLEK